MRRTLGVALMSVALALATGCETIISSGPPPTPSPSSAVEDFIRWALWWSWHSVVTQLSKDQKTALQEKSPTTLPKIEQNDTAKTNQEKQPLTMDDIKALVAAGVKNEVITAEIEKSKSKFSQQDIAELQRAGVDLNVIRYIQDHAS